MESYIMHDLQSDYGTDLLDSEVFENDQEEITNNEEIRHLEEVQKELQKEGIAINVWECLILATMGIADSPIVIDTKRLLNI